MNTIDSNVIRAIRPGAAVAIVGAVALTLIVIGTLVAQIDANSARAFAGTGDYITKVAEALASE